MATSDDQPATEAANDVADQPAPSPTAREAGHRRHRTWPQRLLLALNIVVVIGCFAGAGALVIGRSYANSINRVDIVSPVTTSGTPGEPVAPQPTVTAAPGETLPPQPEGTGVPVETFPPADPGAKNFLITGADNNACIDPDSPYAPAFGDRESMGERSDTIMILRVDPATKRSAILSFPRDLWVKIHGRGSNQRINTAYVRDDPQRLINTIYDNFFIPVDHFVQVDFCAFKTIVEAVGGVTVPFLYPARDVNTGLYVPEPGCYTFDGDHALAYVRSRKYQYFEDGEWETDGLSDLSRISRQQDFLRRTLSSALSKGIFNPSVASGIIDTVQDYVVVDGQLTVNGMLEFAGVLRDLDPTTIQTYQIESVGADRGGASVQIPQFTDNMNAILEIFRGKAELAGAPDQVFETTTVPAAPVTDDTSTDDTAGDEDAPATTRPATGSATTTTSAAPTTTVVTESTVPPPVEQIEGIVPPRGVECP